MQLLQVNIFIYLEGIGITAYLIVGQASIGDYFKKYVGLAQAILTSGSCVGYTICPPILALLVEYYGWRGAMLLLGGLNLHGFIMALLFPSSKRKPPKTPVKQSQDSSTPTEKATKSIFDDFVIVKDVKFVIYLACMGVGSVGQTTMYVFMVARAQSIGISKENSALLFTIYGIVSIFSRPLFGAIADRIAKQRMALMSVCIIVCGFISAAVNWMDSFWWMVAYVSLFGFLSGKFLALLRSYLKRVDNLLIWNEGKASDVLVTVYSCNSYVTLIKREPDYDNDRFVKK